MDALSENISRIPLRDAGEQRMDVDGGTKLDARPDIAARAPAQAPYTAKQGQYLAFIYYYSRIHGRSPSEADMQGYFRVSPPAVHQMVVNLEKLGFIERTPGKGRSLKLLLSREQLPDLR
jgi:repressor LexA